MANPFRIFRRHQKAMYAVLGIMVMFAFVILPIYMQSMESRGVRNPLVVSTTRYGNIDEQRLANLRHNHAALEQFFEQLARQSQQAEGDPGSLEQMKRVLGNGSERELVQQWLLENRAEELGLDVGDEAITHDLTERLTAAKISNEQVNDALRTVGISQDQLFNLLRKQFVVQRLEEQFGISLGATQRNPLGATTPQQRWEYYQRLRRTAAIEVAGLPVSSYTSDVADPGDAVLKEYFGKYKTHLHNPAFPAPGFKEPKRVAFEYLKADYNKFTAIAKVSEEEIRKYYQEHKEEFKQTLPELPADLQLTPPPLPARVKPAKEKPGVGGRGPGVGDQAKKPAAEKPAVEKPTTEKPTTEKPAAEKPAPEKPIPGKPAAEKPASEKAEKHSVLSSRSPFRLTAEEKPVVPPAKPEEKPAAKPQEKPAVKQPTKPAAAPAATPGPRPPTPGPRPPAPAKKEPPPPTYKPLEKVREEIRRQLAEEKVRDLLEHLRQQFQEYHGDLAIYESQGAEDNAKPPVRPDFKKLAKETGLEARDSGGLLDVFQARALDIGGSLVEGRSEFVSVVFQKLPEFLPRISKDADGNEYLFWTTKETPEKVPEWTDKGVRQQVLAVWKLEQARSIAQKEAQRLARIARQSKLPLDKVLAKRPQVHVYQSDPFTWLTEGSIPGAMSNAPPEISPIRVAGAAAGVEEAVQTPGNSFMQAVFHCERGAVGVAMNQPESTVYVFRVTEMAPASWDAFLHEGTDPYSLARLFRVYDLDRERAMRAWLKSIEETAGFKWEREPVEAARGEE